MGNGATEEKQVILLRETLAQSIISDVVTFFTFVGLIGAGVLIDSAAMQWVGAICATIVVLGSASTKRKRSTFTIRQARARLDELEQSNG